MAGKKTVKKAAKKSTKKVAKKTGSAGARSSADERIGFHKGSLTTLMKERQELLRIVGIVEQLIQMHMGGLQELGVDLTKEGYVQEAKAPPKRQKVPIDQII